MAFKDRLSGIVSKALSDIAPIVVGTVVSFDTKTNTATIRTTHRSGRGSQYYELPWPKTPNGIFANDPQVESSARPGTHAVIGFRGFDWNYPVLLSAYDPFYPVNTRMQNRRDLASWTTRSDKAIIGKIG